MCRQLAIFDRLGLGGMGPHGEHPVVAGDVVGVVHPILYKSLTELSARRTGRMPQPSFRRNTAGGCRTRRGEYWDALSVTAVPDGEPVKITAMEQLNLFVQPISKQPGG